MPCYEQLLSLTLAQFDYLQKNTDAHQFNFQDQAEFDAWRRTVDFTDEDVRWSMKFQFYSGKSQLYIGFHTVPTPIPLDEIEQIIRKALEIA